MLGFVLAAMGGVAWAQESEQSMSVTGRILFGYADLTEGSYGESGPGATLETDLTGYYRDPRILEFDIKPIVSLGQAVPGTEMGNAFTGGSATGLILQGSPFPLTLSYSRFSSSVGEAYKSDTVTNPNQDVLNGVESKTTNSVFDARGMLRFNNWPLVTYDYRDMDTASPLPQVLGGEETHHVDDFLTHIEYYADGWLLSGRYQHSLFKTSAPDILQGGEVRESGTSSDLGFTASKSLPLHSSLGVSADDTKSSYGFDGVESNLSVQSAYATLTSQPVERLSTTLQTQYLSNQQAADAQQALAGAGLSGSVSPAIATGNTEPVTVLVAPYHVLTVLGGGVYRLDYGFSVQGSVGDSHSSLNSGSSLLWNGGLNYTHKWRSGWISTNYSHSQFSNEVEVANGSSYSLFTQHTDLNLGAANVTQRLPRQFQLAASGHVSGGTLTEEGSPYPYHAYGGLATLTRPVGQWKLSGSFDLEEIATNEPGTYNRSKSESASFTAAYRGLNLSGSYLYGSGLAVQVGDSLVYVSQPVNPVLGVPVLSTTRGTSLLGTYQSRRGRLVLSGSWYRFSYITAAVPTNEYDLYNFHASYKLRRLRLIAGFVKQSQTLGVGQSNIFGSRLVYFQVERVFRLY